MQHIYKRGKDLANEIKTTDMPYGMVAVWHLGQSSVVIKGKAEDGAIVIDPYLTDSIEQRDPETEFKRAFAPPLSPEELQEISGVLVTHHHDDHLDSGSLSRIMKENKEAIVVHPAAHTDLLVDIGDPSQLHPIVASESFNLKSFVITAVAAAHTNYEKDAEGNDKYLGYFIDVNGVKVFHSGDTVVTDDLIRETKEVNPDIALLPINGGDYARTKRGIVGNMTFREAADFSVEIGADMLLPIHYDLFPNNRDNPSYFVDYLFHHYPAQKFHMMVPGERFIYCK